MSSVNRTADSSPGSPPAQAAHTPNSDDSKMQEIEKLGQQALAKRKADEQLPVSFKAARQENEALDELANLFLTQHLFTVAAPDEKFAEVVSKVIQTPIKQKDLPRLLAILQAGQLPFLKRLALSNASKTALLTLVAQVLQFLMDASPKDNPLTQCQKSAPYQTILPLMQWLFESKTDRLSKEDEEILVRALSIFSLDTLDNEFHHDALPLISATRAILPAAWSRLTAFPLTVETILPALALLALKDREIEWTDQSFPALSEDAAYTCLREKLKTITDPQIGCALLSELSRLHEIWHYPPLSSALTEELWNLYQRCTVLPLLAEQTAPLLRGLANVLRKGTVFRDQCGDNTKRKQRVRLCMHVLDFAAQSCDTIPIATCLAGLEAALYRLNDEQQKTCLSRILFLFHKLGQNRVCLADLAAVFWLLVFLKDGNQTGFGEPLLKLIQQYDREKLPAERFDPLSCLNNLRKISDAFYFEDQNLREIISDLICRAVVDCQESDKLFFVLNKFRKNKGYIALDAAAEECLCALYEEVSQQANDRMRIYGLLVLAQFLPIARFQKLASHLIPHNFDFQEPLTASQTFEILLKALYDTCLPIEINSEHDESRSLKPIFDLVTNLVTSIVDPGCAKIIFSHLLLQSVNFALNWEGDRYQVPAFFKPVIKLAKKHKLPPLTSEASSTLRTWIEQDSSYLTPQNLQVFAEHPELKLLLPKKPADFVGYICKEISTDDDVNFWNAVGFLTEAGYLKGIDAAASMTLQEALCSEFENEDFSNLSYELTASIYTAIMALHKHKCLNLFPEEMPEEEQNAKRAAMDQLLQKITSRVKSFSGKL